MVTRVLFCSGLVRAPCPNVIKKDTFDYIIMYAKLSTHRFLVLS